MKIIYLFITTLISYIIKGIAGFGNTLVMTPLFSFILESKQITPIDLLFSIPVNTYIFLKDKKHFSFTIILPLTILILLGDIIGAYFLQIAEVKLLKIILSILIILIACEIGTRPKNITGKKPNVLFLGIIGILSGISSGLFGISVLLIAYVSRTTTGRENFRSSIGFVFLIDNIFRLFYYLSLPTPLITKETINYFIILFPAVIIGIYLGTKLETKIPELMMKKILVLLLTSTGIMLLIQNL
jgi:hypothetical protein